MPKIKSFFSILIEIRNAKFTKSGQCRLRYSDIIQKEGASTANSTKATAKITNYDGANSI